MLSEVGSNFWISPEETVAKKTANLSTSQFLCFGSDSAWFSTGRSATLYVLDTIEQRKQEVKKVVVLPPFTCHTVIEPFLSKGYEVHTYHVGKDLMSPIDEIRSIVNAVQPGVFLFHRFFGKDTVKGIDTFIPELRQKGIIVIEDCTQCLYSSFKKSDADYFVGSIRKWCSVPDGGFAVCREGVFKNKPTQMDIALQNAKKEASVLKYEYLFERKGDKSLFLNKYREAEDILDAQNSYYTISDLSALIQNNLDIQHLTQRRRVNYQVIESKLSECQNVKLVFEHIEEDEVPLYCPILCFERQKIQKTLVANRIYAPVVWPKADCCPEVDKDSEYVYEHILCIPIDQRYDQDDMERVVEVIRSIE